MSKRDRSKLGIVLMGGGACWDRETCWGPMKHAWIHAFPTLIERLGGFFSLDRDVTEAADFTLVHFPYCTGDVHLGRHVAKYAGAPPVWHYGAVNVERGLDFLVKDMRLNTAGVRELTVYGYSAGAIGAFSHVERIDRMFPAAARRTLIADAPGLHFGPKFWKKFSPELINDYRNAMGAAGLDLDLSTGQLSEIVSTVCAKYPNWEVGVLQGSKDVIMSRIFGEISMEDHHAAIFGPGGLWERTRKEGDNCASWISTSAMHTFMVMERSARMEAGGRTAHEFVNARMRHQGGASYKD